MVPCSGKALSLWLRHSGATEMPVACKDLVILVSDSSIFGEVLSPPHDHGPPHVQDALFGAGGRRLVVPGSPLAAHSPMPAMLCPAGSAEIRKVGDTQNEEVAVCDAITSSTDVMKRSPVAPPACRATTRNRTSKVSSMQGRVIGHLRQAA